ncbi:MAG: hypothetical protein KatS3mg008_0231 [Acidimicrobiales bacterium]|nr:MAG: hypothetical protein KatS3mg008_0231 [Acidimicrobiales bacterium]
MSRAETSGVPSLGIDELEKRMQAGAFLLDVRQPDEYREAHVPGANLVPLDQLESRLAELPKDVTILCVCRSGARSFKAAELLRSRGFDAVNVEGGTLAWIDSGRPIAVGDSRE